MSKTEEAREVACRCGQVRLEARGTPILTSACYCTSCQTAGATLQARPGAPQILQTDKGTPFMLFRKDRVRCVAGAELLAEHRLSPDSSTRRVVATCCNSAMFLEFTKGHWLSLYMERFAPSDRLPVDLRTMTRDLAPPVSFDDGIPAYATHSGRFMWRLLAAWAAMGFRSPKIEFVNGEIDGKQG
jgi:hypothetical protein